MERRLLRGSSLCCGYTDPVVSSETIPTLSVTTESIQRCQKSFLFPEVLKQLGLFTTHAEASQCEERSHSVPPEFFPLGLFVPLPGAQLSAHDPSCCAWKKLESELPNVWGLFSFF